MTVPPLSQISASTISYCYDQLVKACEQGDLEEVRLRIPWTIPTINQSYPLSMAASFGHVECVKELLSVSRAEVHGGRAMTYACARGQLACVEILAPFAHEENFEQCFSLAAGKGCCGILDILVQYNTNPLHLANAMQSAARAGHDQALTSLVAHLRDEDQVQEQLHSALHTAIRGNHTQCVQILLPLVDPRFNSTGALVVCFDQNPVNNDIFELLFPVSDVKSAVETFTQTKPWEAEKIEWVARRVEQHTLRLAVAEHGRTAGPPRKI